MLAEISILSPLHVVLVAAGVACALSVVLSLLLIVAERYLVNYGTCVIDINGGDRSVEVTGGDSLLGSLRNEGIFIPSACGGRGTCGYCKLKVLDGGGPLLPTEEPLLTAEEIAEDVRVSCQIKVRNDIKVDIPPELFAIREYRGLIERVRDLTHDIKELRIKLLEPNTIEFQAGQYIQIQAPEYGDNPEAVYRAYSMSSNPSETGYVETIVRLVPGGICTTYVFEHLAEGDEILMNGPYGDFRLSDTDKEMVWIAGGSGMSPFWSMVRHMKEHGIARPVKYFFGAVKRRDIYFVDELRALEAELPWFTFIPALSAPDEEDNWDGEVGLITDVVGRNITGDPANIEGYLCGSAGMIDASVNVLTGKGIAEDQIFYDKFN